MSRVAAPFHASNKTAVCITRQRLLLLLAGAFLLAGLGGCTAFAPVNEPIFQVDAKSGYRIANLLRRTHIQKNDPETLFLLTFSGGGTRAAAFSYGVLEELRRTPVMKSGVPTSLLSEVDAIAGVSGGSFTALAYAKYGDTLFGQYESRFLKRNIQNTLLWRALSPWNWVKLASPSYGRSELAADYYDEILFDGATFDDLLSKPTPAIAVTGTDLSTGARFPFGQENFDLICSDLGKVRLARAAATSSAVPVVLSPVTYLNYGGTCGAAAPGWAKDVANPLNAERPSGRALLRYRDLERLQDSGNRPYLHIVDGGVSDNLGLRGLLEALEEIESSPTFERQTDFGRLRRIVVVIVDARSAPQTKWDRVPYSPGPVAQLLQASSVPIDHFSYESVELLKDIARRWSERRKVQVLEGRVAGMTLREAEAAVPQLEFDAIDVSFDSIPDPVERDYFMELPTSFFLSNEAVDRLRETAGRLLRESAGYKRLLQKLGAEGTRPDRGPVESP
ncbi:patatin-like phospholipase family protein [Variovorax sp. GB1R11]|uniref:patatin-like phospholipase family protein n=1 Tax=Variovorax sp. GB1R11 TaxID=3443741 RepID=UPI003F48A13A